MRVKEGKVSIFEALEVCCEIKVVWYKFAATEDIVANRNRNNLHCMVIELDGNSEIGAHVRSNLCYLIRIY